MIAFGAFVPEDLRFSGFNTVSKLARRAAKVSISEAIIGDQTEVKNITPNATCGGCGVQQLGVGSRKCR